MNQRIRRAGTLLLMALAPMVGLFVLLQAVPYGRGHTNPPAIEEPAWDSPRTRELAVRACFDCHSNATKWPGYAKVAPLSWAVQLDVDAGRSVLNFSEWNRPYDLAVYAGERTRNGMMPPVTYLMAHPEANLTAEEREELVRGLDATLRRTLSQRE